MGYLGVGMVECGVPGRLDFGVLGVWYEIPGERCWIFVSLGQGGGYGIPKGWLGFTWWVLWGYHP